MLLHRRERPRGTGTPASTETRYTFAFHRARPGTGAKPGHDHQWLLIDDRTKERRACDGAREAVWRPGGRVLETVPCTGRVPEVLAPLFPRQAGRFWGRALRDSWRMHEGVRPAVKLDSEASVAAADSIVEVDLSPLGPARATEPHSAGQAPNGRLVLDLARGLLVAVETPPSAVELVSFDEFDLRGDAAFRPPVS